jgi:hypothetical protein
MAEGVFSEIKRFLVGSPILPISPITSGSAGPPDWPCSRPTCWSSCGACGGSVRGKPPDPPAVEPLPEFGVGMLTAFALMTAFANGCTAMTGVEAISDGVPAFKPIATCRGSS